MDDFGFAQRARAADLAPMKRRALEQVKEAGRRGLQVERGWESRTQMELVEQGLLWQGFGKPGHWKFTLSPAGERALAA